MDAQAATWGTGVPFRCEQCGRAAGPDMVACPHRPGGGCPYALQRGRFVRSLRGAGCVGSGIVLFGMVVALFPLLGMFGTLRRSPIWLRVPLSLFLLPFLLGGMVFAGVGMFIARGDQTRLHNAKTGAAWQRYSLFGVELYRQIVTGVEPVPLDLELPQPLGCPPSVVARLAGSSDGGKGSTQRNRAVAIFEAALAGLLAQGRIAVRRATTYTAWLGRPPKPVRGGEYLLVLGKGEAAATALGVLEQRILKALREWPRHPKAEMWPQGAPINEAVREVYDSDQGFPEAWLISLVEDDAVARGLGAKEGRRKARFEPDPARAAALSEEARTVRAWSDRLAQSWPDFFRAMEAKIQQGIRSRETSS